MDEPSSAPKILTEGPSVFRSRQVYDSSTALSPPFLSSTLPAARVYLKPPTGARAPPLIATFRLTETVRLVNTLNIILWRLDTLVHKI
jgi:hypothetical protein